MYILEVIPLEKIPLPFPQTLSYFSSQRAQRGALLEVPLGKRKVAALVKSCFLAEEKKMEIRKSPYLLKKVQAIISEKRIISEEQFRLGKWLGNYYLASLGPVFKLFLPQKIIRSKKQGKREEQRGQSSSTRTVLVESKAKKESSPTPVLFWGKETWGKDRLDFYLKEIRKCQAQGKQTLFLEPEIEYLQGKRKALKSSLKNGSCQIEVFHSNLKSSEKFKVWQKVKEKETDIILGTRSALFLPYQNLGLIIVDREESSTYEAWGKEPRYSAKKVALKLAELTGAKIIFGTALPAVESYYQARQGKYRLRKSGFQPLPSSFQIIDMRKEAKRGRFSTLSEKLAASLKETIASGQAILFINRRGLATSLLCQECGKTIKCKNCDVPLVYHLEQRKAILICHHCGRREKVPALCPYCGGWRLKPLGRGTQKVFEELKKVLPQARVLRLDSDIAPTLKKQREIIEKFVNKKADLLVATQLLFKFLSPTPNFNSQSQNLIVGVILIDSLLNLPDFRARERGFQLLDKLSSLGKEVLIQTYNPELSLFQYFKEKKIENFYKEELAQRKAFLYPPFSEIIRLTFSHKNPQKAEKEAQIMKEKLSKAFSHFRSSNLQLLGPAPGFIPKVKGQYLWQIIIKVKRKKLEVRRHLLELISPQWKIEVNPESLL